MTKTVIVNDCIFIADNFESEDLFLLHVVYYNNINI